MKDLGRRFIVGVIAILLVVLLLVYADLAAVRALVALVLAALAAVASWEYAQLAKEKGYRIQSRLLALLALFVAGSFFALDSFPSLPATLIGLSMFLLFALRFREESSEGSIVSLAVSGFSLIYVAAPLGMILGILSLSFGENGRMWIAYLLAVTKCTDMGGYFGGNLFGKRKLAASISPSKTIEGALSGLICALGISLLFYILGREIPSLQFHLGGLEAICLGVGLGCIGQFGDLAESLLKRDARKKDSNALPGMGGALDMVDSLLFNAPALFFYLTASRSAFL